MPIKTQAKQTLGGSDFSLGELFFLPIFAFNYFLGEFSLAKKKRTDSESEYQIGNPNLGALSYLHVGVQLGGIRSRTRNGSGSWLGGTW